MTDVGHICDAPRWIMANYMIMYSRRAKKIKKGEKKMSKEWKIE